MTAEMFEEVGPGFTGVGGTQSKKPKSNNKPKPTNTSGYELLPDGSVRTPDGTILRKGDLGWYDAEKIASGRGAGNETDAINFRLKLTNGNKEAVRILQLMIQSGKVSASASLNTIVSAYEDLVDIKNSYTSIGQNFTLEQVIQREGMFSTTPGTGAPKGPVASVTEVDYGKADVGDKSQGARQARKQIQDFFRESIGRNGTPEEIEEMRVALVKASSRARPTTTVVREGGKTVTKVTPGFDIKSWASGYISTKFADEDVAGTLGSAQDQLKGLARSYGIDMGDSWYATAAKQVGKGVAVEDFLDEIKQTAIGRYPGLADRINKGANVFQVASPYIQAKARILEMDPNSIDLDDMDIQKAIGFRDEKGAFSTRPLWEYEKDLRQKPEWQYTKNARDSYDSLMLKVLRDFGLMG
jgi:hypothetical protein